MAEGDSEKKDQDQWYPNGFFVAMADGEDAEKIFGEVGRNLSSYERYLRTAIKNAEKSNVSCEIKPIDEPRYPLTSDKKLFCLTPITRIKLQVSEEDWSEIDSESIKMIKGAGIKSGDTIDFGSGDDWRPVGITNDNFKTDSNGRYYLKIPDAPDMVRWRGTNLYLKKPPKVNPESVKTISKDGIEYKFKPVDSKKAIFDVFGELNGNRITIDGTTIEFEKIGEPLQDDIVSKFSLKRVDGKWYALSSEEPKIPEAVSEDITEKMLKIIEPDELFMNESSLTSLGIRLEDGRLVGKTDSEFKKGNVTWKKMPEWEIRIDREESKTGLYQFLEEDVEWTSDDRRKIFFEDGVKIYDSKDYKKEVFLWKKNKDEFQAVLTYNKDPKNHKVVEKDRLYTKADTREMKNQLIAVQNLMERPFLESKPLLNLMRPRADVKFDHFTPLRGPPHGWRVLDNDDFKGVECQRDFVLRALNTKDFAILDGPPGTGKTTVIMELIIQLILDGKRILLASSTNAAINNVLERLRDIGKKDEEVERSLFAVRLGNPDDEKAKGVEEFFPESIIRDKKYSEYGLNDNEAKHLIIESSNLVCGTTSGIHRSFVWSKEEGGERKYFNEGVPFDYMIMDESSKTTFQEFIVPARFAKRWVLAGDVKQLSPFTDRDQIVSNIYSTARELKCPDEYLVVCERLTKLKKSDMPDKVIIPMTNGQMTAMRKELGAREPNKKDFGDILLVDSDFDMDDFYRIYDSNDSKYKRIFTDCKVFEENYVLFPKDMIVADKDWASKRHSFQFAHYTEKEDIKKDLDKLMNLMDQKWEEEICWRYEQFHWLRYQKDKKYRGRLEKEIGLLIPHSIGQKEKVERSLKMIHYKAFQSILEMISGEGNRDPEQSVLIHGLYEKELKCRKTHLLYQHRMHSEISEVPRKFFYENNLEDGDVDGRDWSYNPYGHRNAWVHCEHEQSDFKNSNPEEVNVIIKEMDKFIEWASADKSKNYKIAILTFYTKQKRNISEKLQRHLNQSASNRFKKDNVDIRVSTVDWFQGQEADVVFLSMVRNKKVGFMNSPNRLNVAVTRAKHQMVIVGNRKFFLEQSSEELRNLARNYNEVKI